MTSARLSFYQHADGEARCSDIYQVVPVGSGIEKWLPATEGPNNEQLSAGGPGVLEVPPPMFAAKSTGWRLAVSCVLMGL